LPFAPYGAGKSECSIKKTHIKRIVTILSIVVFRSILLIIVIIVVVLAVVGLGWQTFFAGVQKGAEKVGISKALKDITNEIKNSLTNNITSSLSTTNTTNATGLR
jgi:uncharacterized membrane protein